VSECYW